MQELIDFNPKPPSKLPGTNFADQVKNLFKSIVSLRSGNAKPSDVQNDEIWQKTLPDGSREFYHYKTSDKTGDGTLLQDYFKVDGIGASASASEHKFPTERATALELEEIMEELNTMVQTLNTAIAKKLDKTAVVNNLTSTVTTSALSAAQGKALNDKITAVNGTVKLKGTRTANGTWTLTGLAVGKPLFVAASETGSGSGTYRAFLQVISGSTAGTGTSTNGFMLGNFNNQYYSTNIFMLVPTAASVSIKISMLSNMTLYAFQ